MLASLMDSEPEVSVQVPAPDVGVLAAISVTGELMHIVWLEPANEAPEGASTCIVIVAILTGQVVPVLIDQARMLLLPVPTPTTPVLFSAVLFIVAVPD